MKKSLLLFIIFSFLASLNLSSQCLSKKLKTQYTRYAKSENCSINTDVSTGIHYLSGRLKRVAISYVKTGDEFYLFLLQQRQYGQKFKINKDNPLVIDLKNKQSVTVFPCGDFEGRAKFAIGSYYLINREQLKQIADNKIESIRVFISCEKEYSKADKDEEGNLYLSYMITSDSDSEYWSWPARCIMD